VGLRHKRQHYDFPLGDLAVLDTRSENHRIVRRTASGSPIARDGPTASSAGVDNLPRPLESRRRGRLTRGSDHLTTPRGPEPRSSPGVAPG
jgi:hypothetical protein